MNQSPDFDSVPCPIPDCGQPYAAPFVPIIEQGIRVAIAILGDEPDELAG